MLGMMLRPMPVTYFENVKLRIVFPPALSSAFFSNDTTHLCCFNILVFLKDGDLIHLHFQSISSLASSSWCLPINSWLLENSNFSVSLSLQNTFNNIYQLLWSKLAACLQHIRKSEVIPQDLWPMF